jgi:hypothetical protein
VHRSFAADVLREGSKALEAQPSLRGGSKGDPDLRTLKANPRIGWSALTSSHGGCNQIPRHALVLWEFQDGVGENTAVARRRAIFAHWAVNQMMP